MYPGKYMSPANVKAANRNVCENLWFELRFNDVLTVEDARKYDVEV